MEGGLKLAFRAHWTMAIAVLALFVGFGVTPVSASALGAPSPSEIPTQHYPNPVDIGSPFDCPISAHGQYPSRCVWVKKDNQQFPAAKRTVKIPGLWYCPTDYPHPYEVAIGFDPLWQDTSVNSPLTTGYSVSVSPVSFGFLNQNPNNGRFRSWTGTRDRPGYVSAILEGYTRGVQQPSDGAGFRYVCSTKMATSALPGS
jgi:hypothetical protein